MLTLKTAFLVAIASGHRVSSLKALCIDPGHIRWEASGVRLIPKMGFIAKNQSLKSGSVEIFLPAISTLSSVEEDKVWCPVRALKWYVDRTKSKRASSSLFVATIAPHKEVATSTSRLACRVYSDGRYGGHSCWSCSGPWHPFGQFFVGPLQWRQPEGNSAGGLLVESQLLCKLLSQGCCGWWGFFRGRGFEVLCFGILWFRANQEDSLGFALFLGGRFYPSSLFPLFSVPV